MPGTNIIMFPRMIGTFIIYKSGHCDPVATNYRTLGWYLAWLQLEMLADLLKHNNAI